MTRMTSLILIVAAFSIIVDKPSSVALKIEDVIRREFNVAIQTGMIGTNLQILSEVLNLKGLVTKRVNPNLWPEPKIKLFCKTCATIADELLKANSADAVAALAVQFCLVMGLGNDVVCEGMIYQEQPEIVYIATHTPGLTGKDMCGVVFEDEGCLSDNPDRVWEVALPDVPKPPIDEPSYPDPSSVPTLKVLHLSDTHYDPYYLPYSNAVCDEEYFCCRAESGSVQKPEDAAGYWGDYRNCDLPKWTLEALYEYINQTQNDIDYIIWTGDIIPHDVWNVSKDGNVAAIKEMADLLLKYFPGIPVYPAVGNHEGFPVDQFAQPYIDDPEFDMSWLYDALVEVWGVWLPEDALAGVAYSAFYSVLIRPGLRMISLNTNFCSSGNWWLVLDSVDIASELQRLAEELQKAEDNGEFVHIISHHPSSSCFYIWSHQYNRIISRYESTITGIFYGHSHKDHFRLFFDPDDPDRVYEIGYIGQSQTTYSFINPGYKIYTIEGDFRKSKYRVLDHSNWIIELDTANANNFTEVNYLYSAKEDYGISDLSPQSWLDLVYQMNQPNSTLFDDFHRNYVKAATPSLGCDDGCKHSILCGLINSDSSTYSCDKLDNLK